LWRPTKWQEEKLKTLKLQNSKTANFQNLQEQTPPPMVKDLTFQCGGEEFKSSHL
jgi:hypothetical protein